MKNKDEELQENNKKFEDKTNNLEKQNVTTHIVKCKECGAKNTIEIGKKAECEYCGTLLE